VAVRAVVLVFVVTVPDAVAGVVINMVCATDSLAEPTGMRRAALPTRRLTSITNNTAIKGNFAVHNASIYICDGHGNIYYNRWYARFGKGRLKE
jgi:hypothetical protein